MPNHPFPENSSVRASEGVIDPFGPHSWEQMKCYWGYLRQILTEAPGLTSVEALDEYFKDRFVIGSKADLNHYQFHELLSKIQTVAATWGVHLEDTETMV